MYFKKKCKAVLSCSKLWLDDMMRRLNVGEYFFFFNQSQFSVNKMLTWGKKRKRKWLYPSHLMILLYFCHIGWIRYSLMLTWYGYFQIIFRVFFFSLFFPLYKINKKEVLKILTTPTWDHILKRGATLIE